MNLFARNNVIIALFFVMLFSTNVFGQNQDSSRNSFAYKNALELNIFGPATLYSIGYERILTNHPKFKTSVSLRAAYSNSLYHDFYDYGPTVEFPTSFNMIILGGSHHLHFTTGILYMISDVGIFGLNPLFGLGYRYQKPDGKFSVDAGYSVLAQKDPIWFGHHRPSISLRFHFGKRHTNSIKGFDKSKDERKAETRKDKSLLAGRFGFRHNIQAQLFGTGPIYSVGYEGIISNRSWLKLSFETGVQIRQSSFALNVGSNLIFAPGAHHLEVGIGFNQQWIKSSVGETSPTFRLGYRFQKPEGRFFIRTGIVAWYQDKYMDQDVWFMPALNLGYSFGKLKIPEGEPRVVRPGVSIGYLIQCGTSSFNTYLFDGDTRFKSFRPSCTGGFFISTNYKSRLDARASIRYDLLVGGGKSVGLYQNNSPDLLMYKTVYTLMVHQLSINLDLMLNVKRFTIEAGLSGRQFIGGTGSIRNVLFEGEEPSILFSEPDDEGSISRRPFNFGPTVGLKYKLTPNIALGLEAYFGILKEGTTYPYQLYEPFYGPYLHLHDCQITFGIYHTLWNSKKGKD